MRRILITLSILGLAVLAPTSSQAGYAAGDSASCTKYSDGSGYCSGTMRGFRKSGGANDQVSLYITWAGLVSFNANLNNKGYSCLFSTSSTSLMQFATAVTQANGYFVISWDSGGACGYSYYYQGSAYSTYP